MVNLAMCSGVWFWACKCPYMRSWRLVYPPGFSEVEASEATTDCDPLMPVMPILGQ